MAYRAAARAINQRLQSPAAGPAAGASCVSVGSLRARAAASPVATGIGSSLLERVWGDTPRTKTTLVGCGTGLSAAPTNASMCAGASTSVRRVASTSANLSVGREQKEADVRRLMAAKESSGKTFDEIASEMGVTNAFAAQIFMRQAQLREGGAVEEGLLRAVPELRGDEVLLQRMRSPPMRSYDERLLQEPHVYRMHEAVLHYGEALKAIINEQCGDGIMSAIDMYCRVEKIKGCNGEDRVVITFNGKFLPHIEQFREHDTSINNRSEG